MSIDLESLTGKLTSDKRKATEDEALAVLDSLSGTSEHFTTYLLSLLLERETIVADAFANDEDLTDIVHNYALTDFRKEYGDRDDVGYLVRFYSSDNSDDIKDLLYMLHTSVITINEFLILTSIYVHGLEFNVSNMRLSGNYFYDETNSFTLPKIAQFKDCGLCTALEVEPGVLATGCISVDNILWTLTCTNHGQEKKDTEVFLTYTDYRTHRHRRYAMPDDVRMNVEYFLGAALAPPGHEAHSRPVIKQTLHLPEKHKYC